MKNTIFTLALFSVLAAMPAHSENIQDLVLKALKDGKAQGVIDDSAARIVKTGTGSIEDVRVDITKIKDYASGCGRLRMTISQKGTASPALEISICPDGQPPHELELERALANVEAIKSCKAQFNDVAIDMKTGEIHSKLSVSGCPANGKANWRYEGECDALKMADDTYTTFSLSKNGETTIHIVIPAQCAKKNNSWLGLMSDASGMVGDIKVSFPKK